MTVSPDILVAALAGLCLLLALALLRVAGSTGRGNRRRLRHAQGAERRAERLLRAAGYRVEHRQATARWAVRIDGEDAVAELRADLLVRRGRRRYVAEVKTGSEARPTHPATRRQLLEYLFAFDVHGVLLVDGDAGTVALVEFPALPT